ncbi:MAG: 3-keto-5-aminohexanoate cleavage protein [Candidatus Freyarchaeota archaeon]|nr:3-keto-5-aminohexanoate cleavage protein [Candidatus Freyrarchaeum guaymaensis]
MAFLRAWREKLIITCALTGSATIPSQTPYLPITPDQIAEEAYRAWEAGAAVVHVHVRDPKTGMPTADLNVWRETLTKIKEKCDVVVCCTTGGGMGMTAEQRIAVVPEFEPEMCSCNTESMNFTLFPLAERIKEWKTEWEKPLLEASKDFVFKNTFADLETFLKTMYEHNVKPEFEIYGTNGIWNLGAYVQFGWAKFPLHMQFVLGVLGGTGPTVENLLHLKHTADMMFGPQNYTWSVIGVGYPAQFHLGAVAITMGGHVRVGLEDNIYVKYKIKDGQVVDRVLAKSNAELVEKIVKIADELGREIATPADARRMLGLKGMDKVKF